MDHICFQEKKRMYWLTERKLPFSYASLNPTSVLKITMLSFLCIPRIQHPVIYWKTMCCGEIRRDHPTKFHSIFNCRMEATRCEFDRSAADDSTLHSHKKSLDHVEELAREPFFAQVRRKSGNSIASVLQQDWKLILQPSKSNIPR